MFQPTMNERRARPARNPGWKRWLLLTTPWWLLGNVMAQAPAPLLAPSGEAGMIITEPSPMGADVPAAGVNKMEQLLAAVAKTDAISIAVMYADFPNTRATGLRAFGQQLLGELKKPGPGFDFPGLISHNPAFWAAERELAPTDVSLPYLIAMLEILGRDYAMAARTMALAQATLPMPTIIRRQYSRPEAMMLYLDSLLLTGIPAAERMQTAEQCESSIALLRERIARWSNRPGLLRALIELEVRRVELLTAEGEQLGLMNERVAERLNLTAADLAFARASDPILLAGFDATIRDWLNRATLAQQWSRWIQFGNPATVPEVEASVRAYAADGRADLAWLAWRHQLALQGLVSKDEQSRWKTWCRQLLDPASAAYVIATNAANPLASGLSLTLQPGDFSEAWSGDQNIHPLLAVKYERRIAMIDTMLAVAPPGTSFEGSYRLNRAGQLADIDAVEPARRELRRVREIIHDSEKVGVSRELKVMDVVRSLECRLLDTEGHFAESETLYQTVLSNPRFKGWQTNYQAHLYIAGDIAKAHEQYRDYALEHPDDTYRAIMADLTARRLGRRETEILETARKHIRAETWPADGVKYLLGELDEERLLASARQGTQFEIIDHQCEAYFWLGQVALAEGRRDDAIRWLSRCVGTGFVSHREYKIARAELHRLVPQPEPRKSAPENSHGVITT